MTQTYLNEFAEDHRRDLSSLTPTERQIYLAVEEDDVGVREFQRSKGWSSPGTASSILRRARRKAGRAE